MSETLYYEKADNVNNTYTYVSVESYLEDRPESGNRPRNFNLLLLNARSIKNIFLEIEVLIQRMGSLDVIAITETWLKDGEQDYYNLPNYNKITANRPVNIGKTGTGGGVMLFVHKSWSEDKLYSLNSTHNILVVKITPRKILINLVLCYNPHFDNYPVFFRILVNCN